MNAAEILQDIAARVNVNKDNTSAHVAFEAVRVAHFIALLDTDTDLNIDDKNMLKSLCHAQPWLTSVLATMALDLADTMRAENLFGTLTSPAWRPADARDVVGAVGAVGNIVRDA